MPKEMKDRLSKRINGENNPMKNTLNRIKNSLSQIGRKKWSEKDKKNLSKKTKLAWEAGKFNKTRNKKISDSLKLQHKLGVRKAYFAGSNKGKIMPKMSIAMRRRWKDYQYHHNMSGSNHWNWKGGITPFNKLLRCSGKWKIWRELVFLRDNYTCQNINCDFCHNKIGGTLHPHHIKPISLYPELVFDINNGITYCSKFHISSGKLHKIKKEIIQNVSNY